MGKTIVVWGSVIYLYLYIFFSTVHYSDKSTLQDIQLYFNNALLFVYPGWIFGESASVWGRNLGKKYRNTFDFSDELISCKASFPLQSYRRKT